MADNNGRPVVGPAPIEVQRLLRAQYDAQVKAAALARIAGANKQPATMYSAIQSLSNPYPAGIQKLLQPTSNIQAQLATLGE